MLTSGWIVVEFMLNLWMTLQLLPGQYVLHILR